MTKEQIIRGAILGAINKRDEAEKKAKNYPNNETLRENLRERESELNLLYSILYDETNKEEILKTKDFRLYRLAIQKRLENFIKAYEELEAIFENDEFDCNNFIVDNYPFEKSFDEYMQNLGDWQESIIENLNKFEKQ